MTQNTPEWIEKAEGDFLVALRELRVRRKPNYDAVCFHTQQCAEKYLKAILIDNNVAFRKIHDLVALLDDVVPVAPLLEPYRESLDLLTDYAVTFRYPGDSATKETARDAVKRCTAFRNAARAVLGLSAEA